MQPVFVRVCRRNDVLLRYGHFFAAMLLPCAYVDIFFSRPRQKKSNNQRAAAMADPNDDDRTQRLERIARSSRRGWRALRESLLRSTFHVATMSLQFARLVRRMLVDPVTLIGASPRCHAPSLPRVPQTPLYLPKPDLKQKLRTKVF
jgi:hypothetical protein